MIQCFSSLPLKFRYTSGEHDPLHEFYIPVLRLARRYDRAAGYFSSNAFVVAAQGVAHLIAHGGTMRLLVGAQLSPEDAEAIRRGEEERERVLGAALARLLPDPELLADRIARARLEALAWLVAEGRLQIRVVLPEYPTPDRPYFHVKYGVLADACGQRVAFHGSVNETATGWRTNYEDFSVFRSWLPGEDERVEGFAREFERIWRNEHPGWRAYPIPEAVRRRLVNYRPIEPPFHDPLEKARRLSSANEQPDKYFTPAFWLARFLRDAPFFPNAEALSQVTAAVEPWPHQNFILQHILTRYPQRFLIADEVGLGKTIEAGLVLRQLRLMGLAKRALILAPKSLLRQWQEELYEKFNLRVPIYDGQAYLTYERERLPAPSGPAAWEAEPWLLVSAQLARRSERRETLLQARPWDVIVVDEAHHARRRDFRDLRRYRPNRLLALLQALALRTEFLLLLTATPMQVHPIEVWDLLDLLGLAGRWAVDHGQRFLAYFEALQRRPPEWRRILPLLHDELSLTTEGEIDASSKALSGPQRRRLRRLLKAPDPEAEWAKLPTRRREELAAVLQRLARQHTPIRRLVLRHTRALLRRYREEGLLDASVPRRRPKARWIPMRHEETELYRAVSAYIAHFYRRYEENRRGLGFVLTIYRRRLTSSLYALRASLERRLEALRRQSTLLEADDEASAEARLLETDDESILTELLRVDQLPTALRQEEIRALERLIDRLHNLSDHDSKSARLLKDLREILSQRDKVIVFTQYTDTLDYLRERLKAVYGTAVACYSGRGGERWDGARWRTQSKEEVKNAFARGEVRVLLATDAASEGLNLQTCGVLINYDMPWNPMRVEQRIGRIDRIGQRYDEVWIYHYFYKGTIEEKIYRRLGERIGFFKQVIGPLQPILLRVEDLLEQLAILPPEEQEARLEKALQQLEQTTAATAFDLDAWSEQVSKTQKAPPPPWTPAALAQWVAESPALQYGLHPISDDIFSLDDGKGGSLQVTFRPEVFDAHPNSVRLLTYGTPLWETWLLRLQATATLAAEKSEPKRILVLQDDGPPRTVAWYIRTEDGQIRRLETLDTLRQVLNHWRNLPPWDATSQSQAEADFAHIVRQRQKQLQANREANRRFRRSALRARGITLLRKAAALALAMAEREPLFARHRPSPAQAWQQVHQWGKPFVTAAYILKDDIHMDAVDFEALVIFRQGKRQDYTRARYRLATELEAWLKDWHKL